MATAYLKEIDGVLMLPVSPEMQAQLSLSADTPVEVAVVDGQMTVEPVPTRRTIGRYKLSELLADYDQIPRDADEDYEWLNSPPVGRELI
jgi:antitoxin ChpS